MFETGADAGRESLTSDAPEGVRPGRAEGEPGRFPLYFASLQMVVGQLGTGVGEGKGKEVKVPLNSLPVLRANQLSPLRVIRKPSECSTMKRSALKVNLVQRHH